MATDRISSRFRVAVAYLHDMFCRPGDEIQAFALIEIGLAAHINRR